MPAMPGTPPAPTASIAPAAAPSQGFSLNGAVSSFTQFLGNTYGNEYTGPKWGAILGTVATAGIGVLFASSSSGGSVIPTLVGGVVGAGAGVAMGGTFNSLSETVMGWLGIRTPRYGQIPRPEVPAPHRDSVITQDVTLAQPSGPPVNSYLIRPNPERFQGIMNRMAESVNQLVQRRTAIETLPLNSPEFTGGANALRQDERNADQLIQNGLLWEQERTRWNRDEIPRLQTGMTRARQGLGFTGAEANVTIEPAPGHEFRMPTLPARFNTYGRNRFAEHGDVADWDRMDVLHRLRFIQVKLDEEYNNLRPGNGIDIAALRPTILGHRVNVSFLTDNPPVRWAAEQIGGVMITNETDELGQLLSRQPPSSSDLDRIEQLTDSFRGWLISRTPGDREALDEVAKVERYVEVMRLRLQANNVQQGVYQELDAFQSVVRTQFQPFVERVNALDVQIQGLDRQLRSLEQQQMRIVARGQVPGEAGNYFITVTDERNNSTLTMIGHATAASASNFQVVRAFRGGFDMGRASDPANQLATPMPVADIFTNDGVERIPNLGQIIRQATTTMQVRLGIDPGSGIVPSSPVVAPPTNLPPGAGWTPAR